MVKVRIQNTLIAGQNAVILFQIIPDPTVTFIRVFCVNLLSPQKFSRFRVRADFLDGSAICNRMNVQYVRAGTNPEWSILSLHAGFLLSGIESEVWLGSTIPPLQLLQFF